MEKIITCKMCGRLFKGHHNAMYCSSCRRERARENSYENWKRIQAQKKERDRADMINNQRSDSNIPSNQDIGFLDIKIAKEKGMSYGKFSVWKVYHEQEYAKLLGMHGVILQKDDVEQAEAEEVKDNPMDKF